jgi:hypothetical protein
LLGLLRSRCAAHTHCEVRISQGGALSALQISGVQASTASSGSALVLGDGPHDEEAWDTPTTAVAQSRRAADAPSLSPVHPAHSQRPVHAGTGHGARRRTGTVELTGGLTHGLALEIHSAMSVEDR